MPGRDGDGGTGVPGWLFRILVRLHPGDFREDFGADALETFRRRCRDARRSGTLGPGFYLRELGGVSLSLIREWTGTLRPGPGTREDREETMGKWMQDVKYAVRRLAMSPGFTLAAVVTLALGIGSNAAIFSVVNGVLLKPLSYPQGERLALFMNTAPGLNLPLLPLAPTTYAWYRGQVRSFEDLAATSDRDMTITGVGDPVRVGGRVATWSIFNTLGVKPLIGRTFVQDDGRPGAPGVAVLSVDLWRRLFGGAPDVVGRTIRLDGDPVEIVGVVGNGSLFADSEIWRPLQVNEDAPTSASFGFMGVARLAPGITLDDARAEIDELIPRLTEVAPFTPTLLERGRVGTHLRSLKEEVVGNVSQALWVVLGTVGFVLLIACANVANLFIVRAEGRQQEVALRRALGADRASLTRFFSGEALVLGAAGGLGGLALAWAGVRWVRATAPTGLPRVAEIGLDPVVLAYIAGLSVASALLFGVLPMWRFASKASWATLRQGSRGATTSRGRLGVRNALVVGQVALALVLMVGSGLMVRSFQSLRSVDPGFEAEGVLTFRLFLPPADYPEWPGVADFYSRLVERLEGLPGVRVAGAARHVPLGEGRHGSGLFVEDQPLGEGDVPVVVEEKTVTAGYFDAMGIRILAGRAITRADHEDRTAVAVVSQALAHRFWPGESALGKRVSTRGRAREEGRWYTVVGVAESTRIETLTEDPAMILYYPLLGHEAEDSDVVARAMSVVVSVQPGLSPTSLLPAAQDAVWEMDPSLPVARPRAMSAIVADSMARTSFTMVLLAIAGGVSLLLGAVGIFGVISYVVNQRTREIGIRLAVGADRRTVRYMILGQGSRLVAIGALLGLVGAAALARVVEALLHGVAPRDPATFAGVTLLLLAVGTLAAWLPARRATRIDPVEALKTE